MLVHGVARDQPEETGLGALLPEEVQAETGVPGELASRAFSFQAEPIGGSAGHALHSRGSIPKLLCHFNRIIFRTWEASASSSR